MDSLTGKAAFVTGAASGIGLGITEALVAKGARVMMADIDVDELARVSDRLRAEGAGRRNGHRRRVPARRSATRS